MTARKSGLLLHITSLPSPFGVGDLGRGAYRFADFLADAGQSVWQVLPLNPTSAVCGNSPYCSYSAFAGNPLVISPELLVADGLLKEADLSNPPDFSAERVDYDLASDYKYRLLRIAFERFEASKERDFELFCSENGHWLEDYALFVVLKEQFNRVSWSEWPREVRDRDPASLNYWTEKLADRLAVEKFFQYLFFKQWQGLKRYCRRKNIQIIGDIPIYVSYDSSDVWANPQMFKLDGEKRPTGVAGVPPDYFSATGQLWGNPVYDWEALRQSGYGLWVKRLEHNLKLFDSIRLDHFRGLVGYWEVPASEKTAINGKWVQVPARDFFETLLRHFPYLPILAEDLGVITPDVREIMNLYGFPGMKLLLFAFGDDLSSNPYAPHNHTERSVVYTGTHDNNTVRGWFREEARQGERERLFKYVGREFGEEEAHLVLLRLAMMSVSKIALFPLQDVLGLGEEARMNVPAVTYGNWSWRVRQEQLTAESAGKLLEITRIYGRA